MKMSSIFSPCRKYRYTLWRQIDIFQSGYAMFIGLNPSTADEGNDDPTLRRCIRYARDWGYSSLCMTNIFAFRATDPEVMKKQKDPVGPDNNRHLVEVAKNAGIIIAAWGVHGVHMDRDIVVSVMIDNLHCLGLTQEGHPAHPLYQKKDLRPRPFIQRRSV